MSTENRLAARIFASIMPWMDPSTEFDFGSDIDVSARADGLPSLAFRLQGATGGSMRLAVKQVFKLVNVLSVSLTPHQVKSWGCRTEFLYKPHCWVGIDHNNTYFFWEHQHVAPGIQVLQDLSARRKRTRTELRIPDNVFHSPHYLAVFRKMLEFAATKSLCP